MAKKATKKKATKKKATKKKATKKKAAKKKAAKKKATKKKAAKKKAQLKTKVNAASVAEFLEAVPNATRRADAQAVAQLMQEATGAEGKMWGASIVGYGDWTYHYPSGRSGDWFEIGFSPRKTSLTLYMLDSGVSFGPLLARLGKHKRGKGCLYINRLEDVDLDVLQQMIERAVAARRASG